MTSKAVKSGELFFRNMATKDMSAAEVTVYQLRLERAALLRRSTDYHWGRLELAQSALYGSDLDKALEKLNAEYPLGYCRQQLIAVNAAIKEATDALNRFRARNLKPGEHLNTRRH